MTAWFTRDGEKILRSLACIVLETTAGVSPKEMAWRKSLYPAIRTVPHLAPGDIIGLPNYPNNTHTVGPGGSAYVGIYDVYRVDIVGDGPNFFKPDQKFEVYNA